MKAKGANILARHFDVVYVGDFASHDEDWPRVASEVASLDSYGVSTAVVHLAHEAAQRAINGDLSSQVRGGAAAPVNPMQHVIEASTLILTTESLQRILTRRPVHHVFATQILLLCDDVIGSDDWLRGLARLGQRATGLYGGQCLFSAVRNSNYRHLECEDFPLAVAPQWVIDPATCASAGLREHLRQFARQLPLRVGLFGGVDGSSEVSSSGEGGILLPRPWQAWWYRSSPAEPPTTDLEHVIIRHWEMTVGNFLSKVDAVAALPSEEGCQPYQTALKMALQSGLPVILPESWRDDFGSGALYRHPTELAATLQQIADRPESRQSPLQNSLADATKRKAESTEAERQRIEWLIGRRCSKPARMRHSERQRVLFMSTNGMGVGHLSRQIAIARKLPASLEPVFLSLSQAVPIVEQFGFHGEYFPYHLSTFSDADDWNAWLQATLEQTLDAYSIGTLVFDGNMPYAGLCRAVSARNDCRMVWIRRGMWRPDQDNTVSLSRSRYADVVIEPDDIASDLDTGQSAEYRHEVVAVDPIRLLDADELLTRKESCRKLGLSSRRRYALIQLGARNNLNTVDLMDNIIGILRDLGGAQPVIAEWLNAETPLDLWPDIPRLRSFPISRYYRAFDFTISGAGYNSFNEIISFGVPSVLVPNPGTRMDNQSARAAYADDNRAAIHLDTELSPMLREVLTMIQDQKFRRAMVQNCRQLARPNGADAAASVIAEVASFSGSAK